MLTERELQYLLDRPEHVPNEEILTQEIEGKSILVTGGGGSIGSELCRIICDRNPRRLVIYESSEFALVRIQEELVKKHPGLNVAYILDTITNQQGLDAAMQGIDTVYHAAAYKHVPLIEINPVQGILNNVGGTLTCAQSAIAAEVKNFVLISTDKAVAPASVMGATKRVGEMLVQSLAGFGTKFSAVRFGNVIGTVASVIPKFLQQIALGGPVTVTDKRMTRYFMTIFESCALAIQAGCIAEGGEIFLLDLGRPINIYQMARTLIEFSGLKPEKDIEIIVTGIRLGEKFQEDLYLDPFSPTELIGINRVEIAPVTWSEIGYPVNELLTAAKRNDAVTSLELLRRMVPEYGVSGVD